MRPLVGSIGTGAGRTSVTLRSRSEDVREVRVEARWMGADAPLDVTFVCRSTARATHYESLVILRATDVDGAEVPLPPSPDPLVFEVVRVPRQDVEEPFAAVLWLHARSYYDPGDQLPAEEYEIPPEAFCPAARALQHLEAPWKLDEDGDK